MVFQSPGIGWYELGATIVDYSLEKKLLTPASLDLLSV